MVLKQIQAEVADEHLKETAIGEGRITAKKGRMINSMMIFFCNIASYR